MSTSHLKIRNFGPIEFVDIHLSDLTVLVGPQGTGKSLALQWLKLAIDGPEVERSLREAGANFASTREAIEGFFGEGMAQAWSKSSLVEFNEKKIATPLYPPRKGRPVSSEARMLFIPAHRAILLAEGWPSTFQGHSSTTPVVARLFSDALFKLLSKSAKGALFPRSGKLTKDIKDLIDAAIFHGAEVSLELQRLRKRLALKFKESKHGLPFMTWTAGQREFLPLLLGLYKVLPGSKQPKAPDIDWVVIEEPEMGLHPQAIIAVMVLVIDLLSRGYRVVLSTHSPLVLDIVWTLAHHRSATDLKPLAEALGIKGASIKKLRSALKKDSKVYYLRHVKGKVKSSDISDLDPFADDPDESGWGGLTEFSSRLNRAVAVLPDKSDV